MSFGRTDDEGFTPNNRLRKTNFGIGGAATLENGIRINGTLNYANTDYTTPPIAASLGSGSVSSYTSSIFSRNPVDTLSIISVWTSLILS